jgi:hypothetical protein
MWFNIGLNFSPVLFFAGLFVVALSLLVFVFANFPPFTP